VPGFDSEISCLSGQAYSVPFKKFLWTCLFHDFFVYVARGRKKVSIFAYLAKKWNEWGISKVRQLEPRCSLNNIKTLNTVLLYLAHRNRWRWTCSGCVQTWHFRFGFRGTKITASYSKSV